MRLWLAAPRRRRVGFAFALFAALISGGWNDCCCYDPPRFAAPVGYRVLQPFPKRAPGFFTYDTGPTLGTRVGAAAFKPTLRLPTAWAGLGSFDTRIYSLARENDQYSYAATDNGLAALNLLSGSIRSFSGLPSNGQSVDVVLKRAPGGVYTGLTGANGAGIPLLYQCQLPDATCTPAPGGPVSAALGDGAFFLRSFNGATYFLTTLGMWSTPNWGTFFKEATPSSYNYAIAGEDGNLVVATDAGLYKGAGRGGSWAPDNTGVGTDCEGVAYLSPTFYAFCNLPSLQVYKRARTDSSWTSTGLNLSAFGSGLEIDGGDLLLGTTVGPYRYQGGTWALDDPCFDVHPQIQSVRLFGQTLAAGGAATGISESTDQGGTWTIEPTSQLLTVRYLVRNSLGTYFTRGPGTYYRPAGQSAFQMLNLPTQANALGTAGDVVLAGFNTGSLGVGRLNGSTLQLMNTGFDTTAAVRGFASNGTGVVALTNRGNFFASNAANPSWTKGANRSDGFPFIGSSAGIALSNGNYLLGGLGNPSGWNIGISNPSGTTLSRAGVGIPDGVTVNDLAESISTAAPIAGRVAEAAGVSTLFAATSAGLYVSYDGAVTWGLLDKELGATPVNSLAVAGDRLWVGTAARGLVSYSLPIQFQRLVPIVLDVTTASAHYTTELAFAYPGRTAGGNITAQYTAAIGSGSYTFLAGTLQAAGQDVIPDAIAFLRSKGAPIPTSGSQAGTLLFTFTGIFGADVPAVTARTTAATGPPLPVGRAGLAYGVIDPAEGSRGTLTVYGLRSNGTDRSNFAVYNTSNEAVTFSVTAYNGDGSGASSVVASADTLPAWGWKQYNSILDGPVYAQGWVSVTRTSTTGSFGVYGVVNDNKTNDGSFLGPGSNSTQLPAYTNIPVLVETGAFVSELVLSNSGPAPATFHLQYRESLTGSASGSTDVAVAARSQLIVPSAIAYLRSRGLPIGAAGGNYAGSLHIQVVAGSAAGTWVGARTSAPAPSGGNFGLFTPATVPGSEGLDEASVYGLRSDSENRSNVAVVNVGDTDDGSITLSIQAYDGDSGVAKGSPNFVVLAPGQWQQLNNFLAGVGVANGWVKVTRTAGFAPWIAYGVINDGGAPGQRTSDGAYVEMVK